MNVKVIGIGCIGGSIAIKLKKEGYDVEVFDKDEYTLRKAIEIGLNVSKDEKPDANMNILAIPMHTEERILNQMKSSKLILDVSSVMSPFIKIANERKLRFIGGHPMAGNERKGYRGWDDEMFENRKFFLSGGKYAEESDKKLAEEIVRKLGSEPVWIDPIEHDKLVSKISQSIFFFSLAARKIGESHRNLAGPGYISTTRLSFQNVDMVIDMIRYNTENILNDLKEGIHLLNEIANLIENEKYEDLKMICGGAQ